MIKYCTFLTDINRFYIILRFFIVTVKSLHDCPITKVLSFFVVYQNLFLFPHEIGAQLTSLTLCASVSDQEDIMSGSATVSGSSLAWRSQESLKSLK